MPLKLSVFVPTYNRSTYLPRIFETLAHQSYTHFEILIVDDGSTDDSKEVVKEWQKKSNLNIRYIYQENGGKHMAYNTGIKNSHSDLFVELDSDDYLVPDALETIVEHWKKHKNKPDIGNMMLLCGYDHDTIIGDPFPKTITNNYELRRIDKVGGDKCMVYETAKLKQFAFPEIKNEMVTMSILHNRFASQYKAICINKIVQIKEYTATGLTKSLQNKKIKRSSQATEILINEYNLFKMHWTKYIFNNGKYVKLALLNGKSSLQVYRDAINKKSLFAISFIIGHFTFLFKRLKRI